MSVLKKVFGGKKEEIMERRSTPWLDSLSDMDMVIASFARKNIFYSLKEPQTFSSIRDELPVTSGYLYHHLQLLIERGLVNHGEDECVYSLSESGEVVIEQIDEMFAYNPFEAVEGLEEYVSKTRDPEEKQELRERLESMIKDYLTE